MCDSIFFKVCLQLMYSFKKNKTLVLEVLKCHRSAKITWLMVKYNELIYACEFRTIENLECYYL